MPSGKSIMADMYRQQALMQQQQRLTQREEYSVFGVGAALGIGNALGGLANSQAGQWTYYNTGTSCNDQVTIRVREPKSFREELQQETDAWLT